MASDVVAVSYLDTAHVVRLVVAGVGLYEGLLLTSMTAVFGGSAEPEDLKSLARDSRVMNSRSERDMVDMLWVVVRGSG